MPTKLLLSAVFTGQGNLAVSHSSKGSELKDFILLASKSHVALSNGKSYYVDVKNWQLWKGLD